MANLRALPLILTMGISFTVSFSIMWWQRKTAELPMATSPAIGIPMQATAGAPPIEDLALQPVSAVESGRAVPARAMTVQGKQPRSGSEPPAAENSGGNYDSPELPVIFNIVKTTAYVADDSREGAKVLKDVYEAIISNTSEKSLEIAVTEVNLPTQEASQTEFSLPKGTQKHFGIVQGLAMLSGDQITVRSPSYRDLTQMIP